MIFYHPGCRQGEKILPEEESHHGVRVMRLKAGDEIRVLDGEGGVYQARITEPHPRQCAYEILSSTQEPPPSYAIHLAIAPTKSNDRLEWMLEKCVEVGLHSLTLLECQYSERSRVRMDRLEKKMVSAMKQSGQTFITHLHEPVAFTDFMEQQHDESIRCIAHAGTAETSRPIGQLQSAATYLVLIGPEGDFSAEELELANEKNFIPLSLGKSILRTETAGLMACCVLNSLNYRL